MEENLSCYLSEEEKNELIENLTPELPFLRVKAEISQEGISNIIGTSRQTYGAIERRTRKMTWSTYMSLILFYDYNKKTHLMIRNMSAFPHKIIKRFNNGDEPHEFELGSLFQTDIQYIVDSLDEQAVSTLKTVLMVEYSRCNKLTGEALVKFFEGINILNTSPTVKDASTAKAIKNIKRKNEDGE